MANDLYGLARELRSWVRDYLETRLSTFLKVLPYSTSTSSGEHDKVQGYPTEGTDEEKYDYEGRRLQPFGFRSRPPAGVYGVWVGSRGRSGNGVILAGDSTRFGPSDLDDGEVAIYNKANGVTVKLDKNGKITITSATGQDIDITAGTGGTVVINGGTLQVARQTDPISSATAGPYPVTPQVIQSGATNIKG